MKDIKSIKDIAEEALGKMKLPKGATTITIDIIGKGKPRSEEDEAFDFMPADSDLVASLKGIIKTLEKVIAKCEGKTKPEEIEESETEEEED